MENVIDLSLWQLGIAYVFVLLLTILIKLKGGLKSIDIIIACVRMSLQLTLAGYVLSFILKNPSPLFTLLVLLAMEFFASYTIIKKINIKPPKRFMLMIMISIICGTISCIVFFFLAVLQIPFLNTPQYFIPIAGMLIGNTMTGLSLAAKYFVDGLKTEKHLIEGALMLGANAKMALKNISDKAFDSAILPTINSMLGMGIVFLPGLMTGQILSGISPLIAIKYQIGIMLGILGSVALSSFIFLQISYKVFFNKDTQLIDF